MIYDPVVSFDLRCQSGIYVEDDTSGTSYVLSPSHLIYGRKITSALNDSHFEVISTNDTLTKRARQQKHLLSQFTRQGDENT